MGIARMRRSGSTYAMIPMKAAAIAGAGHIRRKTSATEAGGCSMRSAVTHSSRRRRVTNILTSARPIASSMTTLWCARSAIDRND
jgi:hypothetical protein